MKRRYKLKNQANSPLFQQLTGVETFFQLGSTFCEIVKIATQNQLPIQRWAYGAFSENFAYSRNCAIKIIPVCGVLNCVKKDHLKAYYVPTKKDAEYIKNYLSIDGVGYLAHKLDVPVELLENYLKTCS